MKKNVNEVKLRIEKLKTKPVENAALIKKWQRILRKLENNL